MKKILTFDVEGVASLADALSNGITGYATEGGQVGRLTSLWLFLCNRTVLRVQARVTTVGSWHEVGTLVFRDSAAKREALPKKNPLVAWSDIAFVEKLVLEGDAFSAESGLAIRNQAGEEFLILSGAFPHTIEISAPFYEGDFQPEYEITAYKRMPI